MSSLDQQQAAISDRLDQGEVSPEDAVRPGFFGGLDPGKPVLGVASALLETGSVLAGGLPALAHFTARGTLNPVGIGFSEPTQKAWETPIADWAKGVSDSARAGAKAVTPDPRLTGSAGNFVLVRAQAETRDYLARLEMPEEHGKVVKASDQLFAALAAVENAKEDAPLFKLAAECASRMT